MKKYIIILISLFPILLNSQNLEPEQARFDLPATNEYSIYLSSDTAYFQQTRFITDNHWEAHPVLGKIVGYNQLDIRDNYDLNSPKVLDSTLLYVKIDNYWTHCQGPEVVNARGIEYSPILTINPSLTNTVQTVTTSSRNPIFGFQTIRGTKDTLNDCLLIDNSFFTHYLHQ